MVDIPTTRRLIIVTAIVFNDSWIGSLWRWAILLLLIELHRHNILIDTRRHHNIIIKYIPAPLRPSMWYYLFLILLFQITFHSFKFLQSLRVLKSWALAPFELIGAPTAHQTVRYLTHSLALGNLIEVFSKYLLSLLLLWTFSLIKGVKLVVNLERRHDCCWGLSLVSTSLVPYLLSFRNGYLLVFMGIRERRGLRFLVSGWIIMFLSWWGWNELPCWLAQELGWNLYVTDKLFIWKIK
jgi:hypothetical protein